MPVWGIHAVHIRTQYLDMFDLYIFVAHSFNFVEPQVLPLPSYDTKDQVALVVSEVPGSTHLRHDRFPWLTRHW